MAEEKQDVGYIKVVIAGHDGIGKTVRVSYLIFKSPPSCHFVTNTALFQCLLMTIAYGVFPSEYIPTCASVVVQLPANRISS